MSDHVQHSLRVTPSWRRILLSALHTGPPPRHVDSIYLMSVSHLQFLLPCSTTFFDRPELVPNLTDSFLISVAAYTISLKLCFDLRSFHLNKYIQTTLFIYFAEAIFSVANFATGYSSKYILLCRNTHLFFRKPCLGQSSNNTASQSPCRNTHITIVTRASGSNK